MATFGLMTTGTGSGIPGWSGWMLRVLCTWLLLLPMAQGQALKIERSFFLDPTARLGIEEVETRVFQPAPEILSLGYSRGASWLKLTVPANPQTRLVLQVRPAYLDDVQLYSRQTGANGPPGPWRMRQQGDQHPFAQRERDDLNFSFDIEPSASTSTVFYVRLQSASTHILSVSVLPPGAASEFDRLNYMGVGVYVGLVLLLAGGSLFHFAINRDRLWALNAFMQIVSVLFVVVYMGFWSKHITPDQPQWGDTGTSVLVCLNLFAVLLFYRELALAFLAPRWLVWVLALSLLALPWQLWQIWHGHAREAVQLNSSLLLLRALSGLVVVWFFVIDDRLLRNLVRFTHIAQSFYAIHFSLPLLGMGEVTQWHLYPPLLANVFGAVMQHMVLSRRDWLAQRDAQKWREQAASTQQALHWEQHRRAEATSFMSMLLHELKNPLASIRLATMTLRQGRAHTVQEQATRIHSIHQAVDGIDAVLERCRQVDRLEQGDWHLTDRRPEDVADLLTQWVHAMPQASRVNLQQPAHLHASVDAGLLRTMVINLLDNALAYSPRESAVEVTLTHQDAPEARLVITVRNPVDKAAIPDPHKVFQKYYRAETAHQRTGSGLGLFLVKNLALMAGGDVSHRMEHPQAVFELWLPTQ